MGAEVFRSRDGIYLVDWGVVSRIIRSYVRSRAVLANMSVNDTYDWAGPTMHTVEVDWDKVARTTDFDAEIVLRRFYANAQSGMGAQIGMLNMWNQETVRNNAKFRATMKKAQHQTMEDIERKVSRVGIGVNILKCVRDLAGEIYMVSATMLTGPAAAAINVGVASAFKTLSRSQDDPTLTNTQLTVSFASEYVAGALDFRAGKMIDAAAEKAAERAIEAIVSGEAKEAARKAAEKGTKLALGILWSHVKGVTVEPAKAIVQATPETNLAVKGVGTGGLKTAGGIHSEILKYLFAADKERQALAAVIDATVSWGMDKLADFAADKMSEKAGEAESTEPPTMGRPITHQHALLDAASFPHTTVDDFGIRQIGSAGSAPAPEIRLR